MSIQTSKAARAEDARDKRIIAAIKAGVPIGDIKSRFGVGERTVYKICWAHDVPIPRGGNRIKSGDAVA